MFSKQSRNENTTRLAISVFQAIAFGVHYVELEGGGGIINVARFTPNITGFMFDDVPKSTPTTLN